MTTPEPEAVEAVEADPADVVIDPPDDEPDPADTDPDTDVELPQRPALDPEAGDQDAPDA